jgi:hypothetical protein
MALLNEIYVALRTRNTSDAETNDSPVLVVQRGGNILWSDALYGGYLEDRGAGAVFRFDVSEAQIDSADLDLQLWASGDDAWSPEHVIAWGITGERREERVIPLAAFLDLADPLTDQSRGVWVSGDTSEGERILFLPRVGRGRDDTLAHRLIVVTATDPYGNMFPSAAGPGGDISDSGTVGPLTLQAGAAGKLLLDYTLPETPQSDQDEGGGAFYIVDLAVPFSRNDLQGGQFTLTIGSDDWWKPDYFAVFGADTALFGPNALLPFVAASAFDLKQMSSDSSEGWHSVILPTARVIPGRRFPDDEIVTDVGGVMEA